MTDLHMLHPCDSMRLFKPKKNIWFKIFHVFPVGAQMSGNWKVIFMGGEFTRTYMHFKPQENNTHDCWRGISIVPHMLLKDLGPGFKFKQNQ